MFIVCNYRCKSLQDVVLASNRWEFAVKQDMVSKNDFKSALETTAKALGALLSLPDVQINQSRNSINIISDNSNNNIRNHNQIIMQNSNMR